MCVKCVLCVCVCWQGISDYANLWNCASLWHSWLTDHNPCPAPAQLGLAWSFVSTVLWADASCCIYVQATVLASLSTFRLNIWITLFHWRATGGDHHPCKHWCGWSSVYIFHHSGIFLIMTRILSRVGARSKIWSLKQAHHCVLRVSQAVSIPVRTSFTN